MADLVLVVHQKISKNVRWSVLQIPNGSARRQAKVLAISNSSLLYVTVGFGDIKKQSVCIRTSNHPWTQTVVKRRDCCYSSCSDMEGYCKYAEQWETCVEVTTYVINSVNKIKYYFVPKLFYIKNCQVFWHTPFKQNTGFYLMLPLNVRAKFSNSSPTTERYPKIRDKSSSDKRHCKIQLISILSKGVMAINALPLTNENLLIKQKCPHECLQQKVIEVLSFWCLVSICDSYRYLSGYHS